MIINRISIPASHVVSYNYMYPCFKSSCFHFKLNSLPLRILVFEAVITIGFKFLEQQPVNLTDELKKSNRDFQ